MKNGLQVLYCRKRQGCAGYRSAVYTASPHTARHVPGENRLCRILCAWSLTPCKAFYLLQVLIHAPTFFGPSEKQIGPQKRPLGFLLTSNGKAPPATLQRGGVPPFVFFFTLAQTRRVDLEDRVSPLGHRPTGAGSLSLFLGRYPFRPAFAFLANRKPKEGPVFACREGAFFWGSSFVFPS